LNITGNYTQTSGGTLDIDLASTSSFDVLAITGSATLAGNVNIALLGGFTPVSGDEFTIITFGSLNGNLSGLTFNFPTVPNITFSDQLNVNGREIDLFTTTTVATAPEPSTLLLLAAGLAALVYLKRRSLLR
jgi:PEP-CTERM motif